MASLKIEESTRLYSIHIEQQVRFGLSLPLCDLVSQWDQIDQYAYIEHNEDVKDDGSPKEMHIHLLLKFKKGGVLTSALLNRVNVGTTTEPIIKLNNLEHIGKNFQGPAYLKWASACAYLTHEIDKKKHVYSRDAVKCNFDIGAEIDKVLDYLSSRDRRSRILADIGSGLITRFNYHKYVTLEERCAFRRDMDTAFDYRDNVLSDSMDRDLKVMYLQGKSGSGKTTFAKDYATRLGYSCEVSSDKNDPWQDYDGQDCYILDDWRPGGWSIPSVLKMLDNNTASSVSSRYHNKDTHNLKLIIITSTLDFENVWSFLEGDNREQRFQLERRVTLRGVVTPEIVTITDTESGMCVEIPNPAAELIKKEKISMLPGLAALYGVECKPIDKDILLPSSSVDNTEKEKIIYLPEPDYHFDNPEVVRPEDIFE